MSTVLKRTRVLSGMTQRELAARVGISNTHLSLIENARLCPSSETSQKLEAVFDMPVQELLASADQQGTRLRWQPVVEK